MHALRQLIATLMLATMPHDLDVGSIEWVKWSFLPVGASRDLMVEFHVFDVVLRWKTPLISGLALSR